MIAIGYRCVPVAAWVLFLGAGSRQESDLEGVLRLKDEVAGQLAAARGRAFVREVGLRVVRRAELLDLRAVADHPGTCLGHEILIGLGLARDELHVRSADRVLGLTVNGYYDVEAEAIVIVSDVGPERLPELLAHELSHALDDQLYDLSAMSSSAATCDQLQAVRCLVEGSAVLSTEQWARALGRWQAEGRGWTVEELDAPEFLVTEHVGRVWISRGVFLAEDSPIDDVRDAVFSDLPLGMAELVHPWRYASRRASAEAPSPTDCDSPPAVSEGWILEQEGRLGELLLHAVVDRAQGGAEAAHAWGSRRISGEEVSAELVPGCRCDHVFLFRGDGQRLLCLVTQWPSEGAASEFAARLLELTEWFEESAERLCSSTFEYERCEASCSRTVTVIVDGERVELRSLVQRERG